MGQPAFIVAALGLAGVAVSAFAALAVNQRGTALDPEALALAITSAAAATPSASPAVLVFGVGVALTGAVCALFALVAVNNLRLKREIEARKSYEERLALVIGELNHRVKNILAVTQSIVTRTLRPGVDVDVARDMLIGRMHAMSHVVSLLSDSYWQGVKLRRLFDRNAVPHADDIDIDGDDITVSARAAQSLSLVFFELASHAQETERSARPSIRVRWRVEGSARSEIFSLVWEERGATPESRRPDNDFGLVLLDRVAPEALGGSARRTFSAGGYLYELTAPLASVVDQPELERTRRLAPPPPP